MGSYGGRSVELVGADDLLRKVQTLSNDLIEVGGTQTSMRRMANRDLRDAARLTAEKAAAAIATGRYARGAPQAFKVAKTARAKRDRLPVVKIPTGRVGLTGQSRTGLYSVKTRRLTGYRNKAGAGSREDRRIAWAATGGSPGNPHFPGSTNWLHDFRRDGLAFGVDEYLKAVKAVLRDYGLI